MTKVLFVCHGNICRSPMAEYVFRDLVMKAGRSDSIEVSSCAVSREEIGNDVYPPARRVMTAHGVPCPRRAAREITPADINENDYILCMDRNNIFRLKRYVTDLSDVALLGSFGLGGKEIEDPWFTGNFEKVYREILTCCEELLREILARD